MNDILHNTHTGKMVVGLIRTYCIQRHVLANGSALEGRQPRLFAIGTLPALHMCSDTACLKSNKGMCRSELIRRQSNQALTMHRPTMWKKMLL